MKFAIETEDKDLIHALSNTLIRSFTPQPTVPTMDDLRSFSGYAQVPLTPKAQDTIARLKLQGRYAGLVRHLSPKNKKKVREVYKTFGINSAIELAETFRAKCSFCLRGYLAKRRDSHYCSKRCRDASYRRKVSR